MENSICRVALISQQPSQLSRVSVHHRQVERAEIFVEREVREVVIDVKKVGVFVILRWFFVGNPIQFV